MRISRKLVKVAAVAFTGALALSACAGGTDPEVAAPSWDDCEASPNDCNSGPRADGGEITWMINQNHSGVYNTLRSGGNSVYLVQMLEGVAAPGPGFFTPDGEWTWNMDLLEKPAELVTDDPMTVVYNVRPEAVWDDGEPMDIDDAIYLWHHNSNNPDHCSDCDVAAAVLHQNVESIEALDGENGKVIQVTYKEGFRSPEWFARGLFSTYPAHIAEAQGFDWQNDPDEMAASSLWFNENVPTWSGGPYLVEEWVVDERQTLVPNPNWYGAEQPTLDRVNKVILADQPSWVPAMTNGDIDGGSPASFTPDLYERMGGVPETIVGLGSAGAVWEHIDMNMESLSDPVLRKAIFTVIDREGARTRIFGDLDPPLRNNHIFAQLSPYYQDHVDGTGYGTGDTEAARAMLTDAGYTDAEEGGTLTDPEGNEVPTIRFSYLEGNENRAQFAELTQAYLAQIGLTVEPQADPDLGAALQALDYDMVIFGWSGSPLFANSANQFYHSESGSNFGRLNNPQIDQLTLDMQNQTELDVSAQIANQVVPAVLEEAYVMPLWDTLNFAFVSEQFINIRDNHNSSLRTLYNLEEWGEAATAQ